MINDYGEYRGSVVRFKTPRLSNGELVAGLKSGDPRAADALVEQFGASIDRRVWRLLGADSEHCDVVHQVYAQLLDSIGKLRDEEALPDWIAKATVNVVRNELRRRKYRRIVRYDDIPALNLVDHSDPQDRLCMLRGLKILESMKVDYRIVFVMRFIEGAEQLEIARATDCSLSTVKRRIKRARDVFLKRAQVDSVLSSWIRRGSDDDG